MKKTFVITMFGDPFPWTQQYIDGVQHLTDWCWKIFTPHPFQSKGNVEIIDMNVNQYNNLVEKKLGVRPNLSIHEGKPTVHITDFYIFSGVVFEDYLTDSDFWGITNMDVVYGRLNRFFPDHLLEQCTIFSDDVKTINGVFTVFRNTPEINHLYEKISVWKEIITQPYCGGCIGTAKHTLYGSDEYYLTKIVVELDGFLTPRNYPMLSHDRLEQHFPTPKLQRFEDGSLWELFKDLDPVNGQLQRLIIGREIPYFHFSRTKRWPSI